MRVCRSRVQCIPLCAWTCGDHKCLVPSNDVAGVAAYKCAVCFFETRANSLSVPLRRSSTKEPVCGNCWCVHASRATFSLTTCDREFWERTSRKTVLVQSLRCFRGNDGCGPDLMRTASKSASSPDHPLRASLFTHSGRVLRVLPLQGVLALLLPAQWRR